MKKAEDRVSSAGRLGGLRQRAKGVSGVITLVCGFLMMWGSARGSVDQHQTQQDLYDRAIPVDARVPSGSNNDNLVLATGRFSSSQQLEDEFLKPGPYLLLRRRVEMFQWVEEFLPDSNTPEYRLKWQEGQIDFFKFQNPTGHENPLLRFEPISSSVESASFGGFDGSVLLRSVRVLEPLELAPELLKDPSLRIEGNKISMPRNPGAAGETSLGDMRVWYEVLPQTEYSVLTMQKDERNLVGAEPSEELIIRRGNLSKDEFFKAEQHDVGRVSTGLLYLGGVLFFVGLCSLLMPFAPQISLRPHVAVDGSSAVVLISFGLSLLAVCFFFLAGYF